MGRDIERRKAWQRAYYAAKRHARFRETPEQRAARLEAGRLYAAEYRTRPEVKVRDRAAHRLRRFGLDEDAYSNMLTSQNFCCAICSSTDTGRKDTPEFVVDHDHESGKVRGLLCTRCNTGIGLLRDDPTILLSAVGYLKRTTPGLQNRG